MAPILASYGFIVDSIGADAINAFDANTSDDGMLARAQLVEDQLNLWNQLNTTTTEPTAQTGFAQPGLAGKFTGMVNLQDVGLMGHSAAAKVSSRPTTRTCSWDLPMASRRSTPWRRSISSG